MGKSRMIRINDTYFIESDGNSFELKKDTLTHDKKGIEFIRRWDTMGAYNKRYMGMLKSVCYVNQSKMN